MRYVFRHWPIESIHKQAAKAAEAAECAGDQGKFWEMHARLFANSQKLMPSDLTAYAAGLGLDASTFQQCLSSGKYGSKVQKDLVDGKAAGASSTPTFFIGQTTPDNQTIRAAAILKGAKSYAVFKETIDKLLAERPRGG